jgi:ABC-type antimicrobial peptide transport system permease subunit
MLSIYGVLSYTVATRKQEIGVRMALGATRQRIYALTMSEVTIPVLAGLLGGWAASLLIGRVVAVFLPARRAATIDPMEALRTE